MFIENPSVQADKHRCMEQQTMLVSSYYDFQGPYVPKSPARAWVSLLPLASVDKGAGTNRRDCPQTFSTLKLSSKREEVRK